MENFPKPHCFTHICSPYETTYCIGSGGLVIGFAHGAIEYDSSSFLDGIGFISVYEPTGTFSY